jgi:hypothetical protein
MVNRPNASNRPFHNGLIEQITNDCIINAKRFDGSNLIGSMYQRTDRVTALRKRLNDCSSGFASRTCDQNHD